MASYPRSIVLLGSLGLVGCDALTRLGDYEIVDERQDGALDTAPEAGTDALGDVGPDTPVVVAADACGASPRVLYVAPTGSDDDASGPSCDKPLKTIGKAIERKQRAGYDAFEIHVCEGTFEEAVVIPAPMKVRGSFDCKTWKPNGWGWSTTSSASPTIIRQTTEFGVRFTGVHPAGSSALEGFAVTAPAMTTSRAIGIEVQGGASPSLENLRVELGNITPTGSGAAQSIGLDVQAGSRAAIARVYASAGGGVVSTQCPTTSAAREAHSIGARLTAGVAGVPTVTGSHFFGKAVSTSCSQAWASVGVVLDVAAGVTVAEGALSETEIDANDASAPSGNPNSPSVGLAIVAGAGSRVVFGGHDVIRAGTNNGPSGGGTEGGRGVVVDGTGDVRVFGTKVLLPTSRATAGTMRQPIAFEVRGGTFTLENSYIVASPTSGTAARAPIGVDLASSVTGTIRYDTFLFDDRVPVPSETRFVRVGGAGARVDGNLFFAASGAQGFVEFGTSAAASGLASLWNNLFVGNFGSGAQADFVKIPSSTATLSTLEGAQNELNRLATAAIAAHNWSLGSSARPTDARRVSSCESAVECFNLLFASGSSDFGRGTLFSGRPAVLPLATGSTNCFLRKGVAGGSVPATDFGGSTRSSTPTIGALEESKTGCP